MVGESLAAVQTGYFSKYGKVGILRVAVRIIFRGRNNPSTGQVYPYNRRIYMTRFKKMTFLTTMALAAALAGKATAAETATTSISGTPIAGGFQYDISVTNTSTDGSTIGTLWFAWIPGDFYMEATPTDPGNSAGWQNNIIAGGGESIQWQAGSNSLLLAPGGTDQFTFDSTEPISQLEGLSTEGNKLTETTSFLYSGDVAFAGTGVQIVIPAAVPEPATLGMLALSGGALLLRRRRRAA
jgi:hypothetical protein